MPSVQHKDVPDSERHDPKGLSTATSKQVYVASGPNAGSWRRLFESDFDYTDKTKNVFGWNDIADATRTSGSPLVIPSATRTLLPNDGAGAQTDTSRLGPIWDAANSRFLINDLNAVYLLNINMKIKTAAAAGTPWLASIELQSANGPTVVRTESRIIKGGGAVNGQSFTFPIYNGPFINNNYLNMYITCDAAIDVYDIGFVIQRSYKESA